MSRIKIHDKIFEPYIHAAELDEKIKQLALRIHEEFRDEVPVFVGVLNGVFMFFADLLKHYPGPCEVAFLQMSSYSGTSSTGIVYQKMDLTKDVENRSIILVEDIVDTGNTIESLYQYFQNTQNPKNLKVAALLLKPEVYKKDFELHYVAMEIPNKFVVGYGLDYDEQGRNLPDLYQICEEN